MRRFIVVGAGQAGLQIVESLRKGGFDGELVLVGEERSLPYQRPPLSKKYLLGEIDAPRLLFRPAEHYAKLGVDVRLGTRVTGLDAGAREVTLGDGTRLGFDRLALVTGARVRTLSVPGADDPRVCYLRGMDDAEAIRGRLADARRIVIVGGGFIGLEVAAVARSLGRDVTVLEAQPRVLPRVVAPLVSEFFADLHGRRGVRILAGRQVSALRGRHDIIEILTADGDALPADLVIVGIGVLPNTELAEQAGLVCDAGIIVDEFARTSDPAIVAAGDCTRHRNLLYAQPHRLESVQNAVDQGKVAAASLLDSPVAYAQVPWFWSDQYEFKLQMAGISTGYDDLVVRGTVGEGGFSVFYYKGERVIAVDSVNRPADHMAARRIVVTEGPCAKARVADPTVDIKTLI
ncbi:MAG: NAD(P)/FAD-dependent oxidoreductase [Gammaproteobacteria bacterium]